VNVHFYWGLVLLAFACEYVDSTLGMGYGTTLTPLLLLFGFGTKQIVPSVLLSEFVTGLLAGGLHHGLGNVRFTRGSRALRVCRPGRSRSTSACLCWRSASISWPR
jgi:uncharacterized membrane protein YfcA